MASDHNEVADREPDHDREQRLYEILAAYFEEVEAGRAPDRAEWLGRYPDRADELAAFLDERDRLLRLTEPFRPSAPAQSLIRPGRGPGPRPTTGGVRSVGAWPMSPGTEVVGDGATSREIPGGAGRSESAVTAHDRFRGLPEGQAAFCSTGHRPFAGPRFPPRPRSGSPADRGRRPPSNISRRGRMTA
jgi:hypothetical protein